MEQFTCSICGRTLSADQFYKDHAGKIYPLCKLHFCEKYIDNNKIEEACKILDVPMIYQEINYSIQKAKEKWGTINFSGKKWFGPYLAKMQLKVFKQFTYKDSKWLNEVRREKTNKTIPIGIKGIIWYKNLNIGEEQFNTIINNYNRCGIAIIDIKLIKGHSYVLFENGDNWKMAPVSNSQKASRCNISYIERSIDQEIIQQLIRRCTTCFPFSAFSYYGEYEKDSDD